MKYLKRKLSTLLAMEPKDRYLAIEAICCLAIARFCVRFLPMNWYVGTMDSEPSGSFRLTEQSDAVSQAISQAIKHGAKNVPWNAVCLPQAIAAKWMLNRRQIPGVLYLGVSTLEDPSADNTQRQDIHNNKMHLSAHAWLKVGDRVVTGKNGHKKFTVLKAFY